MIVIEFVISRNCVWFHCVRLKKIVNSCRWKNQVATIQAEHGIKSLRVMWAGGEFLCIYVMPTLNLKAIQRYQTYTFHMQRKHTLHHNTEM